MAEKATQAAKPKKQTKFLKALGSNPTNLLAPGTLGSSGDFGGFIVGFTLDYAPVVLIYCSEREPHNVPKLKNKKPLAFRRMSSWISSMVASSVTTTGP